MSTGDSTPTPLALPAELTIYTVGELHPAWCAWLAAGTAEAAPAVAAGAVDQIDGAGLQLLIALGRGLAQQGRSLRLQGPSAPLRVACGALGLSAWLEQHTANDLAQEAA